MALKFKELMDKMGVPKLIGAYETYPWSAYDDEKDGGTTCSAEVRMGPDADDIEAEIQLMRDEPAQGALPMEQIVVVRVQKKGADDWNVFDLWLKGKPFDKAGTPDWQNKSCNFFRAAVQEIAMDKIPDFERLIARELHDRGGGGDNNRGGGGGKKPKVRGGQLMGTSNKGGGF